VDDIFDTTGNPEALANLAGALAIRGTLATVAANAPGTQARFEIGGSITQVQGDITDYSIVPYQTTHYQGGAIMGADARTSVVNPFPQSWDLPNLFVIGASAFPQNLGSFPTATVGALAFRVADAIINQYLANPGPLA
jgi:choline dehydrogenase-like flavoprotein